MKLLIIRHGDPDYEHDSLTEKGFREAEYLSERLAAMNIDHFYVSPLGRAADTLAPTLKKNGMSAEICPWLREFDTARIQRPDVTDRPMIPWDWLPQDWMKDERFFQKDHWFEHPVFQASRVKENYDYVTTELDRLLARHGYVREGCLYRAENPSNERIVLVCHMGLECVLLSHLLNISPMIIWHGICTLPTSVTTVVTEERRAGIAAFRAIGIGDVSHLYSHGEEPSFSARFCECYTNEDERHD